MQKLNIYLKIAVFIYALPFSSFNCNAQSNTDIHDHNYGFSFFASNKNFHFKDAKLHSDNNIGFGVGLFYIMKINQSFGLNIELKSGREYHKFLMNEQKFNISQSNLSIPLELQYNFRKTNLFVVGGLEYLYIKPLKIEPYQLNRNLFETTSGLKYSITFEHFKIIPEIKYYLGLNNAMENANLSENLFAKKSGFEFTIKFM